MERREFVATMAAAGMAGPAGDLAIDGGKPVRETPLVGEHWGPLYYDQAERAQVTEVIDTGMPFRYQGRLGRRPDKVDTYEKEFAARMQTRYAIGLSSGTGALECAVSAFQIGPGDEVILPAWTWFSTCTAVIRAGALPVFAEIDESFNLDPADIEHRITPQTKAIIAVHLQGTPADMDPILAIARKHRLRVLEDCAQAVGGAYKGKPLGSIGDMGIYSHQLSKTITAGEGGSLVTSDPVLFERACRFSDVGMLSGPHQRMLGEAKLVPIVGSNFRMSEFTGGVMLVQLRKMDKMIQAARANAAEIYEGVRDLPGIRFRLRPDPAGDLGARVFIRFDSKERRDRFQAAMKAENVPVSPPGGSVVLPTAACIENKSTVHPAWPSWSSERGKAIRYGAASCPRTLDVLSRFAGVAVTPKYTRKELDQIVAAIRKVYPRIVGA